MLQGTTAMTWAQPQLFTGDQALKLILFFIALIIILSLMLYLLKSFHLVQTDSAYFRVLGTQSLGGRDKLLLVNIHNKTFVLASAGGQVAKLHCFDEMIQENKSDVIDSKFKLILGDLLCRNKS